MVKHEQSIVEPAIQFTVLTAGSSEYGALARSSTPITHSPPDFDLSSFLVPPSNPNDPLSNMKSVQLVSSYGYHSVIMCVDAFQKQRFFATGWNHCQELVWDKGHSQTQIDKFTELTFPEHVLAQGIKQITCSYFSTTVLTDANRIYMFGRTSEVQNNIVDQEVVHPELKNRKIVKIGSTFYQMYALLDNGDCMELKGFFPITRNVHDVIPGGYYCVFIMKDGTIAGSGQGSSGEMTGSGSWDFHTFDLGDQKEKLYPATVKVKQITCNWYQTLILTHTNELYVCGSNNDQSLSEQDGPVTQLIKMEVPLPAILSGIKYIDGCHYDFIMLTNDRRVYAYGSYGVTNIQERKWVELQFTEFGGKQPIDIAVAYHTTLVLLGYPCSFTHKRLYEYCKNERLVDIDILTQH